MFQAKQGWNVSYTPLILGGILSFLLLLAMYYFAEEQVLGGSALVWTIVLFATVQAMLQIVLFMHVGVEASPKWSLMVLLFMIMVIFILVGGSLWIMMNINYNASPL